MRLSLFMAVILQPALAAQPLEMIRLADHWAAVFGVERELVHAVIEAESGWNPRAVSTAGAAGLMQLMPDTAAALGVSNRFDISENIRAGVRYLAKLLKQHAGDRRLALASYNAGEKAVSARGLAYSEPQVVAYVARVAAIHRRHCRNSLIAKGGLPSP